MKKLIVMLLMLPLTCWAQKSPFSYGTNGMGILLSTDQLIISRSGAAGPFYNPTMTQLGAWVASQISGSCTATAALVLTCQGGGGGGASTFDQLGSGTNTTANAMFCSTGCLLSFSGTGTVNANWVNGSPLPNNCGSVGTNASNQIICQNGIQYVPVTYAAIAAIGCTSATNGFVYYVTDANSPAYNANITSGGGSTKVLALCNGTNWTAH
jgi:hypothetical protein